MNSNEGCPTCGSRNFGNLEVQNQFGKPIWKKQCYNCKKFWYSN